MPRTCLLHAAVFGLSLTLASIPATAQHKRQLDAHEHGAGTLNIAIEGNKVEMELEVPGDDIVGFEHAATTKKQKAAVDKARRTLAAALTHFKLPSAAGCKVETAKVELHTEEAEKEPAAAKKDTHGHAHGDKKGHDHDHDEGHTEFHANYTIACAAPDRITEIAFDYFKAFRKAQKLKVNLVSDKGQKQYEVTRKAPRLVLGGNS